MKICKILWGDMTVGQGFSENSGGEMTQDGHDYRTYRIKKIYILKYNQI